MHSQVAVDSDVFRSLVAALNWAGGPEPDAEAVAAVRVYFYITNPLIPPTVAADIEQANEPLLSNWKNYQFEEIAEPDDFYRGCVKGMANRYMDYYPDPRDCHVVAEVECAKVGALLTLNADLVRGLGGSSEIITIAHPSQYWRDAQFARGTPPRFEPDSQNPLAAANWWRW
jgi:hypothetical protein